MSTTLWYFGGSDTGTWTAGTTVTFYFHSIVNTYGTLRYNYLFSNNNEDSTGAVTGTSFSSTGSPDVTLTFVIASDLQGGHYFLKGQWNYDSSWHIYPIRITNTGTPPTYDPPLPTGVTLVGGVPTGTATGENNMITTKRLVAINNDQVWYESL